MPSIEIAQNPTSDEKEFIFQQLVKFSSQRAGEANYKPLTIFLREADKNLVGGLLGATYWQWLYVEFFWIHESWRKQGYGDAVLAAAEQEAMRRGCEYAYLDTFSFQAPEFYQKRGYIIFGELPGFPENHSRYFLKKTLSAHSSSL